MQTEKITVILWRCGRKGVHMWKGKHVCFSLVIVFVLAGCDNGTTTRSENSNLIGYWRSEKAYQSPHDSKSYYDIFIFRQNKVLNFSTTSFANIEQTNYDSAFYTDWWESYVIDNGKIIIEYDYSDDGYIDKDIIPFNFLSDDEMILTLPRYYAEYMGTPSRDVKYIRIK